MQFTFFNIAYNPKLYNFPGVNIPCRLSSSVIKKCKPHSPAQARFENQSSSRLYHVYLY